MAEAKKLLVPDLSDIELRRRGQQDPGVWWSSRGQVEFNGLATRRISKLSLQLGLGARPARLLVMPDTEKQNLYIIPVDEHPLAVHVRYGRSKSSINLSALFAYLGHTPLPGSREFHPLEFALEPVSVSGKATRALVMPMKAAETQWKRPKSNSVEQEVMAEALRQAAPTKG